MEGGYAVNSIVQVVNVILPLAGVCIISVMVDVAILVLEKIMGAIKGFPDVIEGPIAYILVLIVSFLIFWQGNFDLFLYFTFQFNYEWQGFLMTALVVSGGSIFIRKQFDTINTIPAGFSSVTATVRKFVRSPIVPSSTTSVLDNSTGSATFGAPTNIYYEDTTDYSDSSRYKEM